MSVVSLFKDTDMAVVTSQKPRIACSSIVGNSGACNYTVSSFFFLDLSFFFYLFISIFSYAPSSSGWVLL